MARDLSQFPWIVLAAQLALSCNNATSRNDIILAFEAEHSDIEFAFCGYGGITCTTPPSPDEPNGEFLTTSDCLLSAWAQCEPVKLRMAWNFFPEEKTLSRDIYVVPGEGKCRLVVFEVRPESPETLHRVECNKIEESENCGTLETLEPSDCELVEASEFDPLLP